MKKFFLTIGIIATIFLLGFTAVVGISLTRSLIEGKTPEEAVLILADQIDLLSSRQSATEATTTALVSREQVLEDSIDALSAVNALLKSQNEALEAKTTKLDQDIKTTASAIPPPPPASTYIIKTERRDFSPEKMWYGDGEIFRIATLRFYNIGNASTTVREIAFNVSGACEMGLIWSESGNGKRLGSGNIAGCEMINAVPIGISIPAGESRDVVVMAQMISPFRKEERNDFQVRFEGIPELDQYPGLPVSSYLFTASSTPK